MILVVIFVCLFYNWPLGSSACTFINENLIMMITIIIIIIIISSSSSSSSSSSISAGPSGRAV